MICPMGHWIMIAHLAHSDEIVPGNEDTPDAG